MKYSDIPKKSDQVIEINLIELESIMKLPATIVIDVREKGEQPPLNPITYLQVPVSAFENYMREEIIQENIILLCQHGVRSLAIGEYLHEKYGASKNIYSLKGGIIRWESFFTCPV